jgi:hypothetical protein
MAIQKKMKSKNKQKKTAQTDRESEETSFRAQHDLEEMEKMLSTESDTGSDTEAGDSVTDEDNVDTSTDEDENDNSAEKNIVNKHNVAEEDGSIQGEESCTVDLRNLVAINSHQIDSKALYKKKSRENEQETTIHTKGMALANENYLLQKASEGCSELLTQLWKLDTEKTDAGPLAVLPSYFEIVTPRELVSV